MDLLALALSLHILAALIWVGGMFFAWVVLRPAASTLDKPQRLFLWRDTLGLFFSWVWTAIIALLLTGIYMIARRYMGHGPIPLYVHLMVGIGVVMMLIFGYIFFLPYRRLSSALQIDDLAAADRHLVQIRKVVGINLLLGIVVIVLASSGAYFL